MFIVPLLGVAGLALIGAGAAASMNRLAVDVRAALVLPVGAAVVACASTLVLLGAPVRAVGVALVLAGVVAAVKARRRVRALARGLAVPGAVAVVALSLASIPALTHGRWDAASSGNGDHYYWVSESRAFLEGPAPAPSTRYPDRDMYELVTERHGTFGIAFSLSLLSVVSGRDPGDIYSAFAALIDVVLALVVFALARGALAWSSGHSAAASVLVAGNAYLLFGTFYGWQAQLLLTAFGLLALMGTYAALESGAEQYVALAALGTAAGVCTYGAAFGPFLALGIVVIGAYWLSHRDSESRKRAARSVGAIALLVLLVAAVPIWRSVLLTGRLAGLSSTGSLCADCQIGLPSESLGLIPRFAEGARWSGGWSVLSLVTSLPLFALGFSAARREAGSAILLWGSAAAFAAIVLLGLASPNPYLSMKVAGYAAPVLTLTVLAAGRSPFRVGQRLAWVAAASLATAMFVVSTVVVEVRAARFNLHAQAMTPLLDATRRIPVDARIAVDVDDAWHQSWAIYYLRDHPLVIRRPQYFLSGRVAAAQTAPEREVDYVLSRHAVGPVVWRGAGLVLSEARKLEAGVSAYRVPAVRIRAVRVG